MLIQGRLKAADECGCSATVGGRREHTFIINVAYFMNNFLLKFLGLLFP